MDKNTVTGIVLIAFLVFLYGYLNTPSQEEVNKHRRYLDSLRTAQLEEQRQDSILQEQKTTQLEELKRLQADSSLTSEQRDSVAQILKTQKGSALSQVYGQFSKASVGEEKLVVLENEKLKIEFTNKGGRIRSVEVKGYEKYNHETEDDAYDKAPVKLMNNQNDRFNWLIPHQPAGRGAINTSDLYFEVEQQDNALSFKAYSDEDRSKYIEQRYILSADGYTLEYDLRLEKLKETIPMTARNLSLEWRSYLDKIEKNPDYERTVSSVHYRPSESSPTYCSCAADDNVNLPGEPLQWTSHSQQFFTMALIAKNEPFAGSALATRMTPDAAYLKILSSQLDVAYNEQESFSHPMLWYLGPNEYNTMAGLDVKLEYIIPFGWSFFGTINRYVIRPVFNVLASFIGSYGLIILILTLIIKMLTFPLQHKLALSSVKMGLIKPEIEKLRKKYEKDPQALQAEQMKLYNMYGVNPLGGCLPMVITMPVWIALYRFFPASIEFRQKSFLWADDLASYDSIYDLGFNIPLYGDHISLFTLLWTISMFAYLYYNSKQMDMSAGGANQANMKIMKYFQFGFPIIFFFTLNGWASGLTAYMLFSNLTNIAQTYLSKNVLVNKDKVWAEMQEIKKNPPKSKAMNFLAQAMKQQEQAKQRGK